MSEIQRYDPDARHLESGTYVGFLTECADGEAVFYDDHAAAMAAKDAEIEELKNENARTFNAMLQKYNDLVAAVKKAGFEVKESKA